MAQEIERRFVNINSEVLISKINNLGAKEVHSRVMMRRQTFDLPDALKPQGEKKWGRIRDEGDKITMTLKKITDSSITGTEEFEIIVNSFDEGVRLLSAMGLLMGPYQENFRQKYLLDGCEITIDEWPGLEPFVEIEGASEEGVREVINKLGFDFENGKSGSIDGLYLDRYGISNKDFNKIMSLTFENFESVLQ